MLNLIQSDIYRVRRGAALRNCLIVLFLLLVFVGVTYRAMTSEGITILLDEAAREMSMAEMESVQNELAGVQDLAPKNAAAFAASMLGDNFLVFFILPLIITVFCADFTAGTYRNTLSFAGSRTEVYIAKLLVSVLGLAVLQAAQLVFGWLIGGVLFGFGGFTGSYFVELASTLLLLLPVQLGIIGFGHMLIAFTRRSSATVGAFIGVLMGASVVMQLLTLLPSMRWLGLLDWNYVGNLLVDYRSMTAAQLVVVIVFHTAVAAATTVAGIMRYNRTDMA